jgi:hypothetical protein
MLCCVVLALLLFCSSCAYAYYMCALQSKEDTVTTADASKEQAAKQRQVMNIAYGPGKSLMSTAFMLWMSGSSVQIFSIMATGMALVNPLKGIGGMTKTFARFEGEGVDLFMPKAIFLALQVLAFGVGMYKCSTMGLLPLTSSDWTQYLPVQQFVEFSGFVL